MSSTCCSTTTERAGGATFKGNKMTLIGPALAAGMPAPDFQVLNQDLTLLTLAQLKGKPVLISVVPSLDTGICDAQTRRFNEEAAKLPAIQIVTISMDLPFAQKRWCGAAGIDKVKVASDHREASFGKAYGTLIKELRLLARAIFLVDSSGILRYVEYVPEVATHPNYDAALAAARQVK
jgi:thiol peroxidase